MNMFMFVVISLMLKIMSSNQHTTKETRHLNKHLAKITSNKNATKYLTLLKN